MPGISLKNFVIYVRNIRPRITPVRFSLFFRFFQANRLFLQSDSALNLLFFDLVAMGLVGSLPKLAQRSPKISGMK
jgi:hypothetical protein